MYAFIHTDLITGSDPGIPYSQINFRKPSKVHSAFSSCCTHTNGNSLKISSTFLSPAYYSSSTVSICFLICALVYYILEILSISFLIFLTFYVKYTRLSSGSPPYHFFCIQNRSFSPDIPLQTHCGSVQSHRPRTYAESPSHSHIYISDR